MNMGAMTRHEAREEMGASKHLLEVKLGRPVESFAYPGWAYSPACPEAAQLAGYNIAVTGQGRGGWDRYQLRRENIDALDDRLSFGLKSRHLWHPLRRSPAGPLARGLARRFRHPNGRATVSAPRPPREPAGATPQREK
jgi:hypothetical protein